MTALYCDYLNQLYGFIITYDVITVNTFFKLFFDNWYLLPLSFLTLSYYNIVSYKTQVVFLQKKRVVTITTLIVLLSVYLMQL